MVEAAGVEPDPAPFDNLRRRATLAPKPKGEKGLGPCLLSQWVHLSRGGIVEEAGAVSRRHEKQSTYA